MNWYIFDYDRCGIYKIKLSQDKLTEIIQELIKQGYYDTHSELEDEDVLRHFGFKPDECEWMITKEDLNIQMIDEPLK